jgi:cellulose biosynthesis protein BcsQ/tetratricopeptide (TPR) repeat protein
MTPTDRGQIVTFYSYKGGTGRSMALANVAWILASNGYQVLAVDWDLESPGLEGYFHPFLVDRGLRRPPGVIDLLWDFSLAAMVRPPPDAPNWIEDHAQILRYAASIDHDFPNDGTLDLVSAGQSGSSYGVRVSKLDWDVFYRRQGGGELIERLRQDMRANYDYVLVDSRTGLSDTAGICTVALPDIVVDCFTLSTQAIDGALTVARSIMEQGKRHIRILPVPMRVEDAETTKLEAGRDHARSAFAEFLDDLDRVDQERYWGNVEVPYKSFYAYEEILAVIGDRPHQENTLLAAYERLAAILTEGAVRELVPLSEVERRRRLAEFERAKLPAPSDIFVSYEPQDRMWAEWIAFQLETAGYRVVRQGHDFPAGVDVEAEIDRTVDAVVYTIAVLTPDYVESPQARMTWDAAITHDPQGDLGLLLPVQVTRFRPHGLFASRQPIDLVGRSATAAREELLAALRAPTEPSRTRPAGEPPRFPGDVPLVFEVPARNPDFVGREPLLLEIRDQMTSLARATVVPQALHGLGGVGKTQVAIEYAHRFAADYDLVWWVPAEQLAEARSSLVALAEHLGMTTGDDATETLRSVLGALGRGDPIRRWLLVYDNADDIDEIQRLFPQSAPSFEGHILVTSRNQHWGEVSDTIAVDVFTRQESIELLTRRGTVSREDADRLAERLGDLPLALEQAAIFQATTGTPVEEYLVLLDEEAGVLSQGKPRNYPASVAATWGLAFGRLRSESPAALQLLQLCTFFGADPIPFYLLKQGRHALSLPEPLRGTLSDTLERRRAVRAISRYALARVDPGRDTLVIHRLVQDVLRDGLSPQDREAFQSGAQELLAAASPGNPDNDQTWALHADLLPHVMPSKAIEGRTPEIRKVILDQVRYRYRRGDFEGSRELADQARQRWTAMLGPDHLQTLLVSQHLADALWWLGRLDEARALRQETFDRMREVLGPDHELTLMTANGLGADLRVGGRFAQAKEHDEDCLERHRRVFGFNDPNTLRSANNLAADLRLLGDFAGARELDQDTLDRRRKTLREEDSDLLGSISCLTRDLIGISRYASARALLEHELWPFLETIGPSHNEVLRASRTLALVLRRSGAYEEGRALAEENLELHLAHFGELHLDTLAAVTGVCHHRRLAGDLPEARIAAEQASTGYRRVLGADHPFSFVGMVNLAVVCRAMGELDEARELDETALAGLEEVMGPDNRFTLCCRGNLATDLAAAGDHAAARQLSEQLLEQSRRVRGEHHSLTLGCALNLALDIRADGESDAASARLADVQTQVARVLGEGHPQTLAARGEIRFEFDIEPPDP